MTDTLRADVLMEADDARRRRRLVYAAIIAVAAGQTGAHIATVAPHLSANDRSRWCTVWALVERGTYRIDEITFRSDRERNLTWETIDKVRVKEGDDFHFYSSKPALFPTVVAGVYWCVKEVTGWNLLDDTADVVRLILVFVNLLPLTIALVVVAAVLDRYARSDTTRCVVLITAAGATLLSTFSVTLNNHLPAAVSVVLALYPAMRIVVDERRSGLLFAACGFFAALAATCELPAGLFGLAMFAVALKADWKRTLLWFVPAAAVPLAAFFATTWLQTGGWKPFYMYFGSEIYEYDYYHPVKQRMMSSYWKDPQGIDKPRDSTPVYLLHCTVGHHGIFSLSPIFLLSLAGWLLAFRRGERLRTFLWMGLLLTALVLAFYLWRTENYNYGGRTAGLRWMIWLIPFWLIALIPAFDRLSHRRWMLPLAVLLLAVSAFSAWEPIEKPWQDPWLFRLMEQRGWIDYS